MLAMIAATGGAYAQGVTLKAWTDSTSYEIGRWITLRIDGEMPARVDSLIPVVFDTLGPFEVLARKASPAELDGTVRRQSWKFRLITFDAGDVKIPSVPFAYRAAGDSLWQIARTLPLALAITTVAVDTAADFKDIKPPVDAPWTWNDVLPYLIFLWAAAVIAALAFLIVHYRKKRAAAPAPAVARTAVPAHEAAIAALHSLEERHLWQKGKVKEYYSEVTEIIRQYFELRFHVRALEMTTDEVLAGVKRIREADPVVSDTSKLLITADLVKFAKYTPTPDENAEEMALAYSIVRRTAPKVAVHTEPQKEPVHAR
jgi:hypothetical protein